VQSKQVQQDISTDAVPQHEMFHLDLAADSSSNNLPNPRIVDLEVRVPNDQGALETRKAYGTRLTKILARWQGDDIFSTGYWVQRNADNLKYYALAKYVMTKNGNIYPHLPIVITRPRRVNRPALSATTAGLIVEFVQGDGSFYWNTSSDSQTLAGAAFPTCADGDGAGSVLDINGFAPDSAYPSDYTKQVEAWIKDLGAADSNGDSDSDGSGSSGTGQQIALATYIDPGANKETWNRIVALASDKVSVVVANVVNGPDSSANAGWTDVIPRAAASGKVVLGYVRTGYLGVSFQKFTTRLGSSLTSDWVAQIQEDVDQWYSLYPGMMGGIFFDEGWNDCGADNINAELYKFITQQTKLKYPGAYTVLNPGAPMPQCFEHSADTLLMAEVSHATYTSGTYAPIDWIPKDARKIWHIIYDCPADQVSAVTALARERNVGMLHITDDVEPNPYDSVPSDAYMQTFMDAVHGGSPPNDGVFPWPGPLGFRIETSSGFLKLEKIDYSSATFSWPLSVGAAGYRLFQDGIAVLSLTPTMTTVTIGGLDPGTSYTFGMSAINPDGTGAGIFDTVSVSTDSLPKGGHTVSDVSLSGDGGSTTYTARILVPYAFVRLFIYDGKCNFDVGSDDEPHLEGWSINMAHWTAYCANYLVEGGTLYKYSGSPTRDFDGNLAMPWSWSWQAEVPIVQDGYDWTWTVPIGKDTVKPSQFIVQVQGYGPTFNVFHGSACGALIDATEKGVYCVGGTFG
jgi:hypothetical protein